ncbi:unnamed protein product [Toxocara canis]|uniref:ABC transporter domain-containing protein n=1 Tax=Toxocara canis TaxID=6265 RepID=A0A183U6C3_TOXCA|nr:unnamed protein product [Toxocara canis]
MALFRLVEGCSGSIIIDGREISSLGLHDLRKRLTIIPQDPMLFSGSLRSNLDPFGRFTDEQLNEAMDKSNLLKHVTRLEYGLDHDVGEQGHNLRYFIILIVVSFVWNITVKRSYILASLYSASSECRYGGCLNLQLYFTLLTR